METFHFYKQYNAQTEKMQQFPDKMRIFNNFLMKSSAF